MEWYSSLLVYCQVQSINIPETLQGTTMSKLYREKPTREALLVTKRSHPKWSPHTATCRRVYNHATICFPLKTLTTPTTNEAMLHNKQLVHIMPTCRKCPSRVTLSTQEHSLHYNISPAGPYSVELLQLSHSYQTK